MWDVEACRRLKLSGEEHKAQFVSFSRDGIKIIATFSGGIIQIWDVVSELKTTVLPIHDSEIYAIAFNNEGSKTVSGSSDQTIRLWDLEAHKLLQKWTVHVDVTIKVCYCDNSKKVAAGLENGTIIIWNATTGKKLFALNAHQNVIESISFNPNGKILLSGARFEYKVLLWDVIKGCTLRILKLDTWIYSAIFSSDGQNVVLGCTDITIWDTQSGTQLLKLEGDSKAVHSLMYFSDGSKILSCSQTICIWDSQTGSQLFCSKGTFIDKTNISSASISPDGKQIVAIVDKSIQFIDIVSQSSL